MDSILNSHADHLSSTTKRKKVKQLTTPLTYRIDVAWRFLLAVVGGYIIAMYSAMVIAELFMEYRTSAAMSATLIAFTLHACTFIWVFMVNKTLKASVGVILPALILFVLVKVLEN
ncbi:hypothetical protein RFH42_09965 [Acinetobacter rudis]|uniref:hypothetical protein n=1 Tax=Acinetobacter rudis TaxID=632955 RepID=UPI00280E0967|nr:hypothetical protein [Acinetobacter rudis]MDQ8953285.1 hypothetical protein [Acinetobacter rudis]